MIRLADIFTDMGAWLYKVKNSGSGNDTPFLEIFQIGLPPPSEFGKFKWIFSIVPPIRISDAEYMYIVYKSINVKNEIRNLKDDKQPPKVNNEGQLRWLGPEKGVIGE